jgi:ribonuclease HI
MKIYCDSSVVEACVVFPYCKVFKKYHEKVTTNVGEYNALIEALDLVTSPLGLGYRALACEHTDLVICSDSQLIVNQVNGQYRCRDKKLLPLRDRARTMLKELGATLQWVPREENLAGIALEGRSHRDPS